MTPSTEDQMIYGHEVQPLLRRIRILWHDIQVPTTIINTLTPRRAHHHTTLRRRGIQFNS
jgi:hypothetical protein